MLLHAMEEQTDDEVEVTPQSQDRSQRSRSKKEDSFYDFNDEGNSQANCIEEEANDSLKSAKNIECLHKYPSHWNLFLMYNTVLPSSALVERLFSLGCAVLTPK